MHRRYRLHGCAAVLAVQAFSGICVAAATPEHDSAEDASSGNALQEITVSAQRTTVEQARAAQMEALNIIDIATFEEIKKIPDISVAEAVRRIPGISLETDEGEGRYVNCRGLDADLNSTTFGGLRLPPTNNASPFGGYRAVTLDSIPIGLVGAITVTKSNLPSQDPESLGCGIEITPKTAPRDSAAFVQGNVGGGYEPLRGHGIIDVAVTAGGRFGGPGSPSGSNVTAYSDRPFSAVVTATYYDDHRGIDDVEPGYFDDTAKGAVPQPGAHPYQAMSGIDFRWYQLHRKRHGYGIDLGYQPDADNSWYVRGFDAGYTEDYYRPYLHLAPDGLTTTLNPDGSISDTLNNPGAITKNLRDERETARDRIYVAGGRNNIEGNILDYRVGYTKGSWDKFFDENSTYTYSPPAGSNIAYNYSMTGPGNVPVQTVTGANYLDPTQYQLTSAGNSTAKNFDNELSFASNLDVPLKLGGFDSEDVKVGVNVRLRKKRLTALNYSYPNLTPVTLASVASSGPISYYNNTYPIGVNIAPGYLQNTFGPGVMAPPPGGPTTLSPDLITSLRQFLDVKENVYAAYVQYEMSKGPFGLAGGVRVEKTQDTFNSYSFSKVPAVTDPVTGAIITDEIDTLTPVTAKNSYTNAFPSIQAKYEIQPSLITRATWSTNLARPGFLQSTVSQSIDFGTGQITVGNPALKPATSNSFDLTIEKYLPNAGILSFGLFDKEFKNYIVNLLTAYQTVPGLTGGFNGQFRTQTFSNTPRSHARGLEFNWEQRFKELLPGFLGGLGASANYTFVDSSFQIRPGESSTLPSSSKNTWNAAIFYEQYGVTVRLAAYSTSADLFAIGQQRSQDVFNARRTSMDLGSSYAFTEHLSMYFDAKNLLNTPHMFYQGTPDRPIQREFYSQTYLLGVRFDY